MHMHRRQFLRGGAVILGGTLLGLTTAELVSGAGGESFNGSPDGRFPNIVLRGHDGRDYRFYDDLIRDKIVMINFFFTGCGDICPLSTQHLVEAQRMLGDRVGRDIFMYSITLKPAEDSVEDLRRFAEGQGVGPGWLFLTGVPADIEHLRKALGFTYADPVEDADTSNHIGMLRFGVEPLTRWAACPGMGNPEHIARSILWDLE
jgi:protein SCO1